MQGTITLWNEVIRRAVMDAKGNGTCAFSGHDNKKGKKHREMLRKNLKLQSLNFLNGGGNWELACDCMGREPKEYTKEILGGLNGSTVRRRYSQNGTKKSKRQQAHPEKRTFAMERRAGSQANDSRRLEELSV